MVYYTYMSLPIKIFLAVILGALLGLERESSGSKKNKQVSTSGIRTYALISLGGALAGFFYITSASAIFYILSATICGLIIAYYVVGSLITKRPGITTELSLIFSFLLGFLIASELITMQIILAILVIVLLILSLKEKTRQFMQDISPKETESFISYAIVALVVLPFLPNHGYSLGSIPFLPTILAGFHTSLGALTDIEILNPQKLWFIVALVTGIDIVSYLLGRLLGNKKSFAFTSFVGGFVSSTSATQALAHKSKTVTAVNTLAGAAMVANMASFFQMFLLIAPLNHSWLFALTPTLITIILVAGGLAVLLFSKKDFARPGKKATNETQNDQYIFSLRSALLFAILLTVVRFTVKLCLAVFGQPGFFISSIIASFAGMDTIIISLAEIAGKNITLAQATLVFIVVNATNLLSKTAYSFLLGTRRFTLRFGLSAGAIIASSLLGYVFFF